MATDKLPQLLQDCTKVLWVYGFPDAPAMRYRNPKNARDACTDNLLIVETGKGVCKILTATPSSRVMAAALVHRDIDKRLLAIKVAEAAVGELERHDAREAEALVAATKDALDWAGDEAKISFCVWMTYPEDNLMTRFIDDDNLVNFCRAVSGDDIYEKVTATMHMLPFLHVPDLFNDEEMILALTECISEGKTVEDTLVTTLRSVPPKRMAWLRDWEKHFLPISICNEEILTITMKTSRDKASMTTKEIPADALPGEFSELCFSVKDDIEYDTRLCFDRHRTMEGPVKFEGLGFAVSGHNKHGNPKAIVVQFDEDGKIRCATMVEVP